MTAQPQAAPVDAETATLLDVIATDRVHEDDRAIVEAAIRETAAANGGVMDPNELRKRLYNEHGCIVRPHVIGPTVAALVFSGDLVFEGQLVITTGSTSRNNGRFAKSYRLTT